MTKQMTIWFSVGFAAIATVASARTRESFNDGWEFGFAADDAQREAVRFSPVAVPHDWAIAGPFDPNGDGDTAKLPWKDRVGVYRRRLVVDGKPSGRVFLDIDGAMARATVRVNGQPCGRSAYAYLGFRADATPYLSPGTNEIEVICDTKGFRSRWYPGGGLFRNTWLVKTDDVYLQDDSLRIETKRGGNGVWSMSVSGTVVSRRAASARAVVTVGGRPVGVDGSGAGSLGTKRCKTTVAGYGTADFSLTMDVKNPREWEMLPDAALYAIKVRVTGEGFDDELTRRIGFRDFRFDPDAGFFLNGRHVQLRGVNLHSDLGPLGMAFDQDAMRRQLEVMRDMGANALRTSHNCPAPEVLDLCDEMGFFVWNECFDKWGPTCGRSDADSVETFVPPILSAWVRRDRTHPSVFCWSIGNEITPGSAMPPGQENWRSEANHGTSAERCARFRHAVRAEDASRPVCIGSCFPEAGLRGDYAALDLTGWNYREMYAGLHKRYPRQPMLYSESASALSEYGFYADALPTNKTDYALDRFCVDSYDLNSASWSDIPDREFFRMERDRYCAGEFVWTGVDYLGEPTPYYFWGPVSGKNENCSRSSYFGICDLCVMPKDRFYLYRSHWNRSEFTLHIVPHHWNFPAKVGKTMPVFVYTSADEAELFVNGKSMGRRRKDRKAGGLDDYYSVLPRYRLVWQDVPYAEGEVKAVAYGADGSVLGTQALRTAGAPERVVLKPERVRGKLCVVEVSLADKDGNFVPDDNRRVGFVAEGCEILAVGNADPRGYESFKDVSGHSLRFGRAAVYVRLGDGVGKLKATADGLAAAEVAVGRSEAVRGYDAARHARDVSLNGTWRFRLDGGAWREVAVPHDWSIESAPEGTRASGKEWGFYAGGFGEYERTFTLTEADLSLNLRLVFDGVLSRSRVSVNGGEPVEGSRYGYTGFAIDLKGRVRAGENVVKVTVDNATLPSSRWYMGSGINRSVWLEKRGGEYLVPGSLDVRTLSADATLARVEFSGLLRKGDAVTPVKEVKELRDPVLWTPGTPHLYETEFYGERVRYGVRTIAWSAERGFVLNGKPVELHGACVHHDHGPLGAASLPDAEYRKALQLKRAGFNAVRTSHNPVAEAFLDACDELGLLVMDDMFDGRQKSKTKGDYCEVFDRDWRKDVEWIVRRDRIHPSVVMWSVGNEVFEATEPRAAATTKAMRAFIAELDGTRPVTQAIHFWGGNWRDSDPLAAELDIAGYNYLENFTESDHARLPGRIIAYTETYPKDLAMTWRRVVEHPYVIGEFVWTGIDYLGETGIGRNFYTDREQWGEHWAGIPQFPWHGAYCGDIDLAGTRKPVSHYRETLWNAEAKTFLAVREPSGWKGEIKTTMWSVWPTHDHWTFAGWEGKQVTVEVYSRRPRVRLVLNGEVVAERANGAENAWKTEFELAYRPGELVAEGLDASGAVVERSVLRTAGEPVGVRYTREPIGRLVYITAEVVDAQGTVCPYADREVTFEGDVLGTCSGDLSDNVPAPSRTRKTWLGRALAILRRN